MSGGKHTPGPWSIRSARDGSGDVGITAIGVANVIAECFAAMRSLGENAKDEASANARLMAAAPDLLTAVQNAAGMLDTPVGRRRHQGDDFYADVVASLRAALSKATGGAA